MHSGNLLDSNVEALVNAVNTVGVMGKGIALQFRHRFPDMYADYQRAASRRELVMGRMHVWDALAAGSSTLRFVINFPTKLHWRESSCLSYIETGLVDLVRVIREKSIMSIAVPALGCGNGGLRWADVRPLMEGALAGMPDVDVRIFSPGRGSSRLEE